MKNSLFKRSISFMLAVLMVFSSATVDVSATSVEEGNIVIDDRNEQASALVDEILSQIEGTESAELVDTEVTKPETSETEEVEMTDSEVGETEVVETNPAIPETEVVEETTEVVITEEFVATTGEETSSCIQHVDVTGIESEHNYYIDTDKSWDVSLEGANTITLSFDSRCYIAPGDVLYLYDKDGTTIGAYDDNKLANQTICVEGDKVTVRFVTDSRTSGWGFALTEAYGDFHVWDDGNLTREPEGFVPGEYTYTCINCSETKGEEVYPEGVLGMGSCGENVNWLLDTNGVLTISGTGAMQWYDLGECPWYAWASQITEGIIEEGITEVERCLFYGCSALEKVTIPEGVTKIDYYAFMDCTGLSEITLPSTLKLIEHQAFDGCTNLKKVYVPDLEFWLALEFSGGAMANPLYNGADLYVNNEILKELIIPEGMTRLNRWAFYKCTSIESVTFPSSMENTGAETFYGSGLKRINFSDGIKGIGSDAFANCDNLTSVEIPEECTSIGSHAFYHCDNLTSIVDMGGCTVIGNGAFANCNNLTSVNISDACTTIGESAFYYCESLTDVKIPVSAKCEDGAFAGCTAVKNVTISAGTGNGVDYEDADDRYGYKPWDATEESIHVVIEEGVQSLGNYLFDSAEMTSLTLPKGLKQVARSTFFVTRVENAYFEDLKSFCEVNFGRNSMIYSYWENIYVDDAVLPNEIVIPEGTEYIGDYLFYNNDTITKITLPSSVKSIGASAFEGCSSLKEIVFSDGLISIGTDAFLYCSSLEKISVPSVEAWCKIQFAGEKSNPVSLGATLLINGETPSAIEVPDTIISISAYAFYNLPINEITMPESVVSIGTYAFYGCDALESVTIPNGVKKIEDYTFYGCSSLEEVALSSTLQEIGQFAFYGCELIESIEIPASVTAMYSGAFSGCTGLKKVYITDLAAWYSIYVENAAASPMCYASELYCNGELVTELIIPEGTKVIGAYSYKNCSWLKSITIPDGVETIEDEAFYGCSGLTEIAIPDSVTSIGNSAFKNCSGLKKLTMPFNLMIDSNSIFENCRDIEEIILTKGDGTVPSYGAASDYTPWHNATSVKVVLEEGITGINEYTFYHNEGLKEVVIPESVTYIGDYAFYYCEALEKITMPANLKVEGEYTFYYTEGVKEVVLTKGNGKVADYTSSDYSYTPWCKSDVVELQLTLEEGITEIGDYAFRFCSGLEHLVLPEGVTTIGEEAFYGSSLVSIKFPSTLTTVEYNAFGTHSQLEKVDIADLTAWANIEFAYIGANPLSDANAVYVNGELVEDLVIPEGTEIIKSYTFENCYNFKSLTIPHSVTTIEHSALPTNRTIKAYEDSYAEIYLQENGYTYEALHNYEYMDTVESTCMVNGYDRYVCTTCQYENRVERPLRHQFETRYTLMNGKEIQYCIHGCELTKDEVETEPTITGTCGDNLSWKLYGEDILLIEGTGAMENYDVDSLAPWMEYEFGYCIIKEGVTTIGASAFDSCTSLEYVAVPESLTSVETYAFYSCNKLKEVAFKEALTTIEASAFERCSALAKVTIYENVTSVANSAFSKCSSLIIHGYKGSYIDTYAMDRGISFESLGYYGVCGDMVEWYLIDGTLSFVGMGAMYDYEYSGAAPWSDLNVERVELREMVNVIGDYAFAGLTTLTSITLTDITSRIGEGAFKGCTGLTNIEFPDTQYFYGAYAFEGCTSLQEIILPHTWYEMEDGVFANCTGLTTVVIPTHPIEDLGEGIFEGCTALESVTLEEEYDTIPARMFKGCEKLTNFTFPNGVTSIEQSAFEGCNISELILPDGITSIEQSAFERCNISEITLPETLTTISTRAFAFNPMTSITLPSSIVTIAIGAFKGCDNFESFAINGTSTSFSVSNGVLYDAAGTRLLQCPVGKTGIYEMPRKTIAIAEGAFTDCTKLEGIVLPSSLKRIEAWAFAGTLIKTFEIPASVTSIDFTAFDECSELESILIDEDNDFYLMENSAIYSKDKTSYYYYLGDESEIYVADSVTEIGTSAFKHTTNAATVYLPVSITSLGNAEVFDGKILMPAIYKNCGYLRRLFDRLVIPYQSRGYAYLDWNNTVEHYSLAYEELHELVRKKGGLVSYNSDGIVIRLEYSSAYGDAIDCYAMYSDGTVSQSVTFTIGHSGVVSNRYYFAMQASDAIFSGSLVASSSNIPYSSNMGYDWGITCYSASMGDYIYDKDLMETANNSANQMLFAALKMMKSKVLPNTSLDMNDFGFFKYSSVASVHIAVNGGRVEPTCTEDGRTEDTHCWLCYASEQRGEILPATGHTEVFDLAVEATCTTDGSTEGKHCLVCEDVLVPQEVIPAFGHTEVIDEEAVEATCTEDGNTAQSHCSSCDAIISEKEIIPAQGHTKVVDIEAVEATCTKDGLTEGSHCSVCEEVLSVSETVPALDHDYDEGTVVEVTCTTEGYTVYVCVNCQDEKKEDVKPALGHTEEVLPGKDATETEPGMTGGTWCTVCEEILEDPTEIPALGFAIIYHLAGSKNVQENPERYFVDSERITLTAPVSERAGYKFAGWYLDEEYEEEFDAIETGSTGTVEVYAKWIPYTYTVILTDGSGIEVLQSFTYGEEQALKKNSFKKAGNIFAGWSLKADAIEADFADAEVVDDIMLGVVATNDDNVTKLLYAVWKDSYTITYMGDDYELTPDMENYIEEYKYGKACKLPVPEKEGYVFGGWYKDETLKKKVASITNKMAEDLYLYAKWTPCTYTIKFNANTTAFTTTKVTGSMKTMAMKYDVTTALLANKFVLKGYEFKGWSLTEGESAVVYSDMADICNLSNVQKDTVTLYAQWEETPYTIEYDANGGYMDRTSDEYWYGEADGTVLPVPEKDGYDFAGWYKDAKLKKAVSKNKQKENILTKNDFGDMTLYAKWTGKKYDVVFVADAADATGKMNPQKGLVYGTEKALTKNGFKRTGYAFAGWSLEPVSQEAGLEPQQRVDIANGTKITGLNVYQSSITLYAVWDNQYTATFNAGEGNFADGSTVNFVEYTYMEGVAELPVPEREGYDFSGWYYDAKFKKAVKKDSKTGKYLSAAADYGDMELFAKWTGKKFDVVFNADASDATGKTNTQKNLVYGMSKALTKNGFKRASYVFIGWSLTPARSAAGMTPEERVDYTNAEKVTGFGDYTSNVTLYAVWENRFDVTVYANGGVFEAGETEQTLEYIYTKGVSLPTPEREGYDFAGWYYDVNCKKAAKINKNTQTYLTATTDSKDLELYAKWTGSKYNLTFDADADEATGKTAMQKNRVYGTAKALTKNGFKRAGYKFIGWSLEPISQATVEELANPSLRIDFQNAEKAVTIGTFAKETTLYAVWEKEEYTITYMNMGYFGDVESLEGMGYVTSYTVDDKVVLKRPERMGYTFLGWYSDKSCKKRVMGIEVGSTGDKILYAKWKLNK